MSNANILQFIQRLRQLADRLEKSTNETGHLPLQAVSVSWMEWNGQIKDSQFKIDTYASSQKTFDALKEFMSQQTAPTPPPSGKDN